MFQFVADKAKPRHKGPTKLEKRRQARVSDFDKAGLSSRKGFHRPGSFNK